MKEIISVENKKLPIPNRKYSIYTVLPKSKKQASAPLNETTLFCWEWLYSNSQYLFTQDKLTLCLFLLEKRINFEKFSSAEVLCYIWR